MRAFRLPALCFAVTTLLLMLTTCAKEKLPEIEFTLSAPTIKRTFIPLAALAEYLELPNGGNELRITLSSYPLSCDTFRAPKAQEMLVTVTLVTSAGTQITPNSYPWAGHPGRGESPEVRSAEPIIRIGARSWSLAPGGQIKLQEASLDRERMISGLLDFEFPGTAEAGASRLSGAFKAKLCQVERLKSGNAN